MLRIHSTVLKHHTGDMSRCVLFQSVSVVIASGKRPVPFRTRKLSLTAPMVLQPKGCGRVGHRRTYIEEGPGPGRDQRSPGPGLFYARHHPCRPSRHACRPAVYACRPSRYASQPSRYTSPRSVTGIRPGLLSTRVRPTQPGAELTGQSAPPGAWTDDTRTQTDDTRTWMDDTG